jgi:SAM-dependent methyltransferase
MSETRSAEEIRGFIRERYGAVARSSVGCCGGDKSTATIGASEGFAEGLGYSSEDLSAIPETANLGLSCGNPVALASLKDGETVLDLGSGGGFDCFIAGRKVGASGRVIGVDMTADMIARARGGLAKYRELSGLDNVEFRLGEIEHLPLADASVDVVISNCVLNLSADKAQVWREIARVLRPGGRVAISDIALVQPVPREIARDLVSISACLAGAVLIQDYVRQVESVGLSGVRVTPKEGGDKVWDSYSDPLMESIRQKLPKGARIGDYAVSVNVSGSKGGTAEASESEAVREDRPVAAKSSCCC